MAFYVGFKATIVIEYTSAMPVAILIHSGAPHDSKIFTEIMDHLKRRRIIRKGDTIIFDKGYYSYKNYQIGISKYKIVPLIFSQRKLQITKTKRPINLYHCTCLKTQKTGKES